jgi:hypothetical protein
MVLLWYELLGKRVRVSASDERRHRRVRPLRIQNGDMTQTKDFFVSYTSSDREWAEWVAWELQEAGYTCTIQAWHFAPSQNFIQRMRQALVETRHLVAILSEEYLASEFAGAELDAALASDPRGLRAKLIPVRVKPCTPDELIRSRIYIDLVGKDPIQARSDLLVGIAAARATVTPTDSVRFDAPPRFPGSTVKPEMESAGPTMVRSEIKLLFVGMDVGRGLDLRGQYRQIRSILKGSRKAGPFRTTAAFDAKAETLPDLLTKHLPTIVHFSGNQSGGRILLPSAEGGVTTIPATALAGLLQSLDGAVRMAIIDTCDSLPCAREIVGSVDLAMGVKGKPYDEDATAFYCGFYKALAAGLSVSSAVGQAQAGHRFREVRRTETPQLCVRRGLDPNTISFRTEVHGKQHGRRSQPSSALKRASRGG